MYLIDAETPFYECIGCDQLTRHFCDRCFHSLCRAPACRKPHTCTPVLVGEDAEVLLASLDHAASVDEMKLRAVRAREALSYVMVEKALRSK